MSTRILVTGVAGFIGYHLAKELLQLDYEVIGVDNLNDYYDPELKKQRLTDLYHRVRKNRFQFVKIDIKDKSPLHSIFETYRPEYVVHLAAQAGVRYSLVDPYAYVDSNLVGFSSR